MVRISPVCIFLPYKRDVYKPPLSGPQLEYKLIWVMEAVYFEFSYGRNILHFYNTIASAQRNIIFDLYNR